MQLNFSIKSSTCYLSFLRQLIAALGPLAPEMKIDHKAVASCSLALVEAVNNAIFHAHKRDEEKWIDVSVTLESDSIEMDVVDTGKGFEIPEVATPSLEHIHGRGIFIINSVMHKVEYLKGSKNVLKMIYHL